MERLVLDYTVAFPVSLVLNPNALARYQLLFRHLLFCRTVETSLAKSWHAHECVARRDALSEKTASTEVRLQTRFLERRLAVLRHTMRHTVHTLLYHMHIQVIEPQWRLFEARLRVVSFLATCKSFKRPTGQDFGRSPILPRHHAANLPARVFAHPREVVSGSCLKEHAS